MAVPTKVIADFDIVGTSLAGPDLVARPSGRMWLFCDKDMGGANFDPFMYELDAFGGQESGVNLNNDIDIDHNALSATVRADGSVIVTYDRKDIYNDVYFAIYNHDGERIVDETSVLGDVGSTAVPKVAANPDGTFAIVFHDAIAGLVAYTYTSNGTLIDSATIAAGASPDRDVASLGDDRFVVTWIDANDDVKAQIFTITSNQVVEVGAERTVGTSLTFISPRVVELANGNFLVTASDVGLENMHGRIYNANGIAQTALLTLNADNLGDSDVAALPDGRFVVAWSTFTGNDIKARVFNADGTPNDVSFPVNTATTAGTQNSPSIAVYPDGRFMITWQDGSGGIDAAVFDPRVAGITLSGTSFEDQFVGSNFVDTILGGTGADTIQGGGANDTLLGGAQSDSLDGGGGADLIDGGTGADAMTGGSGGDTFVVDHTGDTTAEAGGGGTDLVQSSVTRTLGANLENLTLTGTGAKNGTGNTLANTITGNSGANQLNGVGGADTLSGGAGADTLNGGLGHDTMTGGAQADAFVFTSALAVNSDTITDFVHAVDEIRLENAAFTTIGAAGNLAAAAFFAGTDAHDASDRIIYDASNGNLYYDRDGNNTTHAQVLIATLDSGLALDASDFVVI